MKRSKEWNPFPWLLLGLLALAACSLSNSPPESATNDENLGGAENAAPESGVTVITSATIVPATAAPTATRAPLELPDLGAAPDFTANDTWLNSPTPLTLADVRGKVVLVEFWTFG